MTGTYPQLDHEKYEELCALATARALTSDELKTLHEHLVECPECKVLFDQYKVLATHGIPSLASGFMPMSEASGTQFGEASALARLIRSTESNAYAAKALSMVATSIYQKPLWRGLIAASLMIGVAFAAYRSGQRNRTVSLVALNNPERSHSGSGIQSVGLPAIPGELEGDAVVAADTLRISELERLSAKNKVEEEELRIETKDAEDRLRTMNESVSVMKNQSDAQLAALIQDRDTTIARLRDAQASYQTVQDELTTLRSARAQELLRTASLEQKVTALNAALEDREKRVSSDEQYLSSDRDIRDLIGARNLYIADIMDVDESGKSRKPFGRVFYTKTKSLVFYAYDLDHQPGVKQASTFQVWGRVGTNDPRPVNLGVLYMDSETNRRWTLRVNDPQQLAQLDAIFVTIEPHVQNDKPTGKPFLYASLRRDANHP